MMQQNFILLKYLSGLRFYNVLLPFYVLYGRYIGLDYQQIFLTQTIFSLTLILLELPAGIFADLVGRRISLICGSICYLMGGCSFVFWPTFVGFSFAEGALAAGYAFFSGSDSALLYESAKESNQLEQYLHQESQVHAYARFGESISGITGGFIATINIFLLAIISALTAIPLIILSFLLKEPTSQIKPRLFKQKLMRGFKKQGLRLHYFLFSNKNRQIQVIILYSSLLSIISLASFWLLQVFINEYQLSFITIGIIWLFYNLLAAITSSYAAKIIQFYKEKIYLLLPIFLLIMLLILSSSSAKWQFVFILFAALTFGIKMPFIYFLMNQRLASPARASVLSVDSLMTRLLFSGLAVLLGYVLDHQSLQQAFHVLLVPAVFALLLGVYLFKRFKFDI
ncbi:MFS transporter [Legionella oakridgensis]|uniref:Arabinose efflux permease n=2 Tax=Legionella oakridgensis TaxID=29423 RepID=W0BAF2_9GAMM|nr:MFS transporter [Legionella oakridgensis]AHE65602.1 arabinose efflux permease [Legionella oakridgensis ATCC 33761 = DSM 21215]ETO94542.1 arabinose efflux permease [Legionella oakridgensis RV-2-2007]KTD38303.1 Major Facilitator Superfamily protein [Legionella oakridgensis]STY15565.1 Major Facilitator Superfamily [Legionella longbeachae]